MVQKRELALGNKFLLVGARSSKLCNVADFIFIALPILVFGIYSLSPRYHFYLRGMVDFVNPFNGLISLPL